MSGLYLPLVPSVLCGHAQVRYILERSVEPQSYKVPKAPESELPVGVKDIGGYVGRVTLTEPQRIF